MGRSLAWRSWRMGGPEARAGKGSGAGSSQNAQRRAQISIAEISGAEYSFAKVRVAEISPTQEGLDEVKSVKASSAEMGSTEVCKLKPDWFTCFKASCWSLSS